jgi:hypothetical protein
VGAPTKAVKTAGAGMPAPSAAGGKGAGKGKGPAGVRVRPEDATPARFREWDPGAT